MSNCSKWSCFKSLSQLFYNQIWGIVPKSVLWVCVKKGISAYLSLSDLFFQLSNTEISSSSDLELLADVQPWEESKSNFRLDWSWYGTGALSHWDGFLREGMCVMHSVRAHFSWQSLCTLQTSRQNRAARLSWRGSDALLQIITPPPDTERHFKSTPPPPRLCSSFISLVREEITVFFFSLPPPFSRAHTHKKKNQHSSLSLSADLALATAENPLL